MSVLARDRHRWLVAGCVSLGLFGAALDATVNVALPTIADAFDTDISSLQWVIIAFVTTNTALGVSLGSAGDRFGLVRFFRLGLVTYVVAMLLLGFAPNLAFLVGARVLQGFAGAAVLSVGPALIALSFSARDRGRALGLMGGTQAIGSVAAGFAGGVLIEAFGWPIIFLGRIPILLVALLLALVVLRDEQPQRPVADAGAPRFDLPGAIALAVAVGSLLVGLNLLRATGVGALPGLLLILTGVVAASIFVRVELRAAWPVFDLSLLRHRPFAAAFLTLLFNSLGAFTIWFVFPFFVADVLDRGPATLGLLLGVQGLCSAGSAPVGGWLADRLPAQRLVTAACATVAVALLWISTLDAESTVLQAALPLALAGIGQGTLRAAARTLVFNSVPPERFGTASGALNLGGSMGLVLSVAAFTAFFAIRLDSHTAQLVGQGLSEALAAGPAHVEAFRETFRVGVLVVLIGVAASSLAWKPTSADPSAPETGSPARRSTG
jgi:EmrB/QacA subfamily drug resistance transporter